MHPLYLSKLTILLLAALCFSQQLRYYSTPEPKSFHKYWIWGLLGGLLALLTTVLGIALP